MVQKDLCCQQAFHQCQFPRRQYLVPSIYRLTDFNHTSKCGLLSCSKNDEKKIQKLCTHILKVMLLQSKKQVLLYRFSLAENQKQDNTEFCQM